MMKNEKGFAIILMVIGIFTLIVTFIGASTSYFNTLYQEIAKQQRAVAAHQAMQDFAAMAHRANEVFENASPGPCPAGTILDGAGLCWPTPNVTNRHCIPHPLGNINPASPRWICRTTNGTPTGIPGQDGVMDVVLQTVPAAPGSYSVAQWMEYKIHSLKSDFEVGLDIIAAQLQNLAVAQSDTAHLPPIVGATPVNFSAAISCVVANPALAAYCKRCPGIGGSNMKHCFRIRVCLRAVPCDRTNNDDWVVQSIGLLRRDNL